jgi:FkbM family methyltransferase
MNLIIWILEKIEGGTRKFKKKILSKTDSHYKVVRQWHSDDPRNLKRTSFDFLDENSIVFDLGGYQGEWTSDIYARYNCNVYVFEPVRKYIEVIKFRFNKNKKIHPYQFGLSDENSEAFILINEFASKIERQDAKGNQEKISLIKFIDFTKEQNINAVDLIKINIEGAEYPLLIHIIESGFIQNINTLLIQFHNFEKNASSNRISIQKSLEKTHQKIFDYPFVWECWQITSRK